MKGLLKSLILVALSLLVAAPFVALALSPEVRNLSGGLNSDSSDFAPIVSPDGNYLYFTSDREGGYGGQDIWVSERKDGKWSEPENVGLPINNKLNQGPDCFVWGEDKQYLYLTYCNPTDDGLCDVYVSERISGKTWSKPRDVGWPINTDYSDANASWDYINQTLYFTSTRPGGIDGPGPKRLKNEASYDIWRCRLGDDGNWDEPENLGAPVNTPQWEGVAFFHAADGYLYFSSNGHGGEGGADVFRSKETSPGVWSEPENMDVVNTAGNDMYFSIPASGDVAYFSSNMSGGSGMEDIYVVPLDIFLDPQVIARRPKYMPSSRRRTGPSAGHIETVYFDFDKDNVRPSETAKLDRVINLMNENPNVEIELQGHACSVGNDDYNMGLSKRRAGSVYKYLVNNRINPDRVSISFYGETRPAEANDPASGNPLNRRVEISIR